MNFAGIKRLCHELTIMAGESVGVVGRRCGEKSNIEPAIVGRMKMTEIKQEQDNEQPPKELDLSVNVGDEPEEEILIQEQQSEPTSQKAEGAADFVSWEDGQKKLSISSNSLRADELCELLAIYKNKLFSNFKPLNKSIGGQKYVG